MWAEIPAADKLPDFSGQRLSMLLLIKWSKFSNRLRNGTYYLELAALINNRVQGFFVLRFLAKDFNSSHSHMCCGTTTTLFVCFKLTHDSFISRTNYFSMHDNFIVFCSSFTVGWTCSYQWWDYRVYSVIWLNLKSNLKSLQPDEGKLRQAQITKTFVLEKAVSLFLC